MDADQYRRLFVDLPLAWILHQDGAIRACNRAARELFGIEDGVEVVGSPLMDYVHPESAGSVGTRLQELFATGQPVRVAAERMLRQDHQPLWVETVASLTVLDDRPAVQVICWDVTSRVTQAEELAHAALHDALTGLPNRKLLDQRWRDMMAASVSPGRLPSVIFCDLNGFKGINDTYGHSAGDEALRAVARRLSMVLRPDDVLGRFGGDEFVALLSPSDPTVADTVAQRLLESLSSPVTIGGISMHLGISLGIAVPQEGEESLEMLLQRADGAMYSAKRLRGATRTTDMRNSA